MTQPQRPRELFSCYGKFGFAKPGLAKKVAKRMSSRGHRIGIYHCAGCQAWHVGSQFMKPLKRPVKCRRRTCD